MADGDAAFNKDLSDFLSSSGDGQEVDQSLPLSSGEELGASFASSGTAEGDGRKSSVESPSGSFDMDEAKAISETTVNEVIRLAEEADELKEHDVKDEELAEAERVKKELQKELEENDGWVKILGNEELMKKVLTEGQTHCRPTRGDICVIRVKGYLASDESVVFENEDAFKFQLGDAEVIPGLDLSVPLMQRGEVATIKIAHRFGFGSIGLRPTVPPNSNLIYEIELTDYENEKELNELTVEQRRAIGNRKRERGNWWYGRNESSLAVQCYRRALEFLDDVDGGIQYSQGSGASAKDEITPEVRAMFDDRLKTLNNLAAAQLKLQAFEPALNSVEAVLKCQPHNIKALFRKGKILGEKGETERALQVLQRAKQLEPEDKSITVEINRLSQRRKQEHNNEKLLYKRMFNKDSSSDNTKDSSAKNGSTSSSFKSALSAGLVLGGVAIAVAGVMAYRYRLV